MGDSCHNDTKHFRSTGAFFNNSAISSSSSDPKNLTFAFRNIFVQKQTYFPSTNVGVMQGDCSQNSKIPFTVQSRLTELVNEACSSIEIPDLFMQKWH